METTGKWVTHAMKKGFAIMWAAVLAVCLAGCQPTPDKGVVGRKDLAQMLDMAAAPWEREGSLREALTVPDRYETYLEGGGGTIRVTVDAQVIAPEADRVPIIRVGALTFSQDMVDRLADALFDDGPLYTPDSLSMLTKSEIEQLLIELKRKKAELEAQGMTPTSRDGAEGEASVSEENGSQGLQSVMVENRLDRVIHAILSYEEILTEAPEEKEYVEVSGDLEDQEIDSPEYNGKLYQVAHMGQPNPDGGMRNVSVLNNERVNYYFAQYVNRGDYGGSTGAYYPEDQWYDDTPGEEDRATADALAYPSMPEEQARAVTDQFFVQIGVDGLECASIEKVIGGSSTYDATDSRIGNLLKAYRLRYVRHVGGIPVTYTNVPIACDDTDDGIIWSWAYEGMSFIVDDGGIVEMEWTEPYKIGETVIEDTAMLPFSKIQGVFEKMIIASTEYDADADVELNISEVRFGLARITEQDELVSGLLVPVWDFFGTRTTYYENNDGQRDSYTHKDTTHPWLTVNAIDGTVIDRSMGY